MCEIFVMIGTEGRKLEKEEVKEFLYHCLKSADANPDGWGAMWEREQNGFMKSPEKFVEEDIEKILIRYRGSRFFAFHTRLATSPVNYWNAHPFTLNGFRGVHNGVVQVPGYHESVDSLSMFKKIEDNEGETLKDKVAGAMSNVTGTYSVLLHSFNEDKLIYYRNSPNFDFMLSKSRKAIYGATRIHRLETLANLEFGFFPRIIEARPESKGIYEIDLNTGFFRKAGVIKENSRIVYRNSPQGMHTKGWQARVYGGQKPYDSDKGGY